MAWSYLLTLLLPIGAAVATCYGHPGWFLFAVTLLVPILDALIGREDHASSGTQAKAVLFYVPYFFIPLWLLAVWVSGNALHSASTADVAILSLNVGFLGAFAAVHGHELLHRASAAARWNASIIFSMIGYGHYTRSHLLHHMHTGDPDFGSTAHRAQSVWAYLPSSLVNGFVCAWRVERERHGMSLGRNRILRLWLVTAACVAVFMQLWGLRGVVLFAAQSFVAILLIEVVGYIQHYGYARASGAAITGDLTWDGDFWLSNRLLINTPCHVAHHRRPTSAFVDLTPTERVLPAGYFTLLWISLIPPLWFSIMDKKVAQAEASSGREER